MSSWLTIAWHRNGLDLLVATGSRRRLEWQRLLHMDATIGDLASREFRDEFIALIAREHLTKAETVVVLPRTQAEVRTFSVPRVPAEELPDIVRFQASREFTAYDPTAPLDFFVLPLDAATASGTPQTLLAATIRATVQTSLEQLCHDAQLKLVRIGLHPCDLVTLWNTTHGAASAATLLVEFDGNEIAQTYVVNGHPISMRSHRLSAAALSTTAASEGESDATANTAWNTELAGEIKRTVVSVQNELRTAIDRIVLIGEKSEAAAASLTPLLPWPTTSFRLEGTVPSLHDGQAWPASASAMIGGTLAAMETATPLIDFLHPKRPPAPASKRHVITFGVAAMLAVLIGLLVLGFVRKTSLETRKTQLNNQIAAINRSKPERTKQQQQLAVLDAWLANDIAWFDEIDWLSRHLPDAAAIVLSSMTMRSVKGVATMTIPAMAKGVDITALLEDMLTDAKHRVEVGNMTDNQNNRQYPIRFQMLISPATSTPAAAATSAAPPTPDPSETEIPEQPESSEPMESSNESDKAAATTTTDAPANPSP